MHTPYQFETHSRRDYLVQYLHMLVAASPFCVAAGWMRVTAIGQVVGGRVRSLKLTEVARAISIIKHVQCTVCRISSRHPGDKLVIVVVHRLPHRRLSSVLLRPRLRRLVWVRPSPQPTVSVKTSGTYGGAFNGRAIVNVPCPRQVKVQIVHQLIARDSG